MGIFVSWNLLVEITRLRLSMSKARTRYSTLCMDALAVHKPCKLSPFSFLFTVANALHNNCVR